MAEKSSLSGARCSASTINSHLFQRPLDYLFDIERGRTISIRLLHHAVSHSANFFRGLLRSDIIFAHIKDHALNKLEGVIQHQLLHFPVVTSAPILSRQKGPPNFNL